MNKNLKLLLGCAFIILGGIFILGKFDIISISGTLIAISYIWPLVISLLGLLMILNTKTQKQFATFIFVIFAIFASIYFTNIDINSLYTNYFTFNNDDDNSTYNFFDNESYNSIDSSYIITQNGVYSINH